VAIARSALFPTLAFDPSYARRRTSNEQPPGGYPANPSATFNTFTLPFDAGWELDLWGRVRREVESARSQLQATADDREALKLLIQGEVATDYFEFRSSEAELDVLRRSIETYRHSLDLTRNRRMGGIATDLDVAQAEAQLWGVEAEIPAVELRRLQLEHALATLCGQAAIDFKVNSGTTTALELPVTPNTVPSELLERRPDVAAAERRMAAANAQIGVAEGAFYPRVQLFGTAGLQSINAGTLFDWPSRFWAVGPSVEFPIFTGGRNRAQLANARAVYDETVAQYRQRVLAAFQDVEDQLATGHLIRAQLEAEQAALVAARRTLEIATNRYRAGLVTFLEVATAQTASLLRERNVVQLQAQTLAASAGLIKAVGGGFGGG
jgi:NodT family efflux transporter outer membrane factor (OMF) lipoprotein